MKKIVWTGTGLMLMAMACQAQNLKPGLWDLTHQMQDSSGQMAQAMAQMQKQLAALPPEQRKMMEDMFAKQGVGMGAGGTAVRLCMTRDMLERHELGGQMGDCKTSAAPRTGNTVKISYACSQPPSSGEGQITYVSDTAYTMTMATQTTVHGKTEKVNMSASGKWVSADCGVIKPLSGPRK